MSRSLLSFTPTVVPSSTCWSWMEAMISEVCRSSEVPVLKGDDEETLSARILQQEHVAYPEAIARVLSGNYAIVDRRYVARASQNATLIEEAK